jgi:hypothetical protein
MTNTPDRFPGDDLVDDAVIIDEDTVDPSVVGSIKYVNGRFSMKDSFGLFDPRNVTSSTSSGLTAADHAKLRQLIHFVDQGPAEGFATGAYKEVSGGIFPTSVIWYTSSAKTSKIVQKDISYNSSKAPIVIAWSVYGIDGATVLATATDSINYTGPFETSRTRAIVDYSAAASTLDESTHKTVRGPFEGFSTNAYREISPAGNPFPLSIVWYVDNTKTAKIIEKTNTFNSSKQVTSIAWTVYDIDGTTVLAVATDTIAYSGAFEISRTRAIS